MNIISKGEDWVLSLYPEVETPTEEALSEYAIVLTVDGGFLVFHTISWSYLFMTKEEFENIFDNEECKKYKIVLDKSIDEVEVAEQVFLKRSQTPEWKYRKGNCNSFVIFTTNHCNARCFYCYEKTANLVNKGMTLETAEEVVQYIKRTVNPKAAAMIEWFGGEPLLNTKVMDYISKRLDEEGVHYRSTIISNSYLFNDENIQKAKDLWKLDRCQITIDGTEEVYNKTKNYRGTDTNPFKTLIGNMHNIIDKSAFIINVRINVSNDNIDDVDKLLTYLEEEFGNALSRGAMTVYLAILYQILTDPSGKLPDGFEDKLLAVTDKHPRITRNDKLNGEYILKKKLTHCMADTGGGIAIDPRGYLAPCEHFYDKDIIGHVSSGITNWEKCEEWRRKDEENTAICRETRCPILPICEHYGQCEASPRCVSKEYQQRVVERFPERMINTYDLYLRRLNELKQQEENQNNTDETKNGEE